MTFEVRQVPLGQSFLRKERNETYDDWIKATPRELFQNSIDSGASAIDVTIEEVKDRGTLFRPGESDRTYVRIVFSDNGCGMDAETIETVYFRPGETTKGRGGDTIGGFGRARLCTNLANHRHSCLTKDRAFEGVGGDYVHYDLATMIENMSDRLDEIRAMAPSPAVDETIAAIESDIARLTASAAQGGLQGCRMEIDIDPADGRYGVYPNLETMLQTFRDYLERSAIRVNVTLNGETVQPGLAFRRATRVLRIEDPENTESLIEFAKVYYREAKDARYKHKMIVRVAGATMFEEHLENPVQVVVEIDPKRSRDVLIANRDGLRSAYRKVLDGFKQEMMVDRRSALEDRQARITVTAGEHGKRKVSRPAIDYGKVALPPAPVLLDEKPTQRRSGPALSRIERAGFGGIPYADLVNLVVALRDGAVTALDDNWSLAWKIRDAVGYGTPSTRHVIDVLEMLGDKRDIILSGLQTQVREREVARAERIEQERARRLQGASDVAVKILPGAKGKTLEAARRNDPDKWSVADGTGARLRAVLAVWEAYCDEAIVKLMRMYPGKVPDDFGWTPGFVYSETTEETSYVTGARSRTILAEYSEDEERGATILFNPVDSDGSLAYSASDDSDRRRLMSLAVHEVAHVLEKRHDEDFANILTALTGEFDDKAANKVANEAVQEIRMLYSQARTARVVPLDNEPGPRPTERLVAALHPSATAAAIATPSGALESLYAHAFTQAEDGSTTIDLARLRELDRSVDLARDLSATLPTQAFPGPSR